jgi:hypothetical protein
MGDDVSHPSHLSERKCGHLPPGFVAKVRSRFADDFDSPDHGILFLRIGPEIRFRRVLHIRCDQARRRQDVAQPTELVKLP